MTALKNHPDKWLRSDAAASVNRLERDHGTLTINSAGRTLGEQQNLIHLYYEVGGPANQPPFLFAPARPAEASRHVKDGGLAIDTPNIAHMLKYGPDYGWYQNFAYDPVHFEYDPARDKHRGGTPTSGTPEIKNIQKWLNSARGEKLTVDNKSGPKTIAAIKSYQTFLRKYGYKGAIDGKWGTGTQAAHSSYYAAYHKAREPKSDTVRRGDTGFMVSRVQKALVRKHGYKLDIDERFGPGTEAALKDFQSKHGLDPDGIAGPKTFSKLEK